MSYVIQMRGRAWPQSMCWQDTTFRPDDRGPDEWVALMNGGDPEIEYRVVYLVGFSRDDGQVVQAALIESISACQTRIDQCGAMDEDAFVSLSMRLQRLQSCLAGLNWTFGAVE